MEIRIRSCQGVSLITCPWPLLVLLLHHPVPHPLLPYLYILALPVFRDEGRETSHSLSALGVLMNEEPEGSPGAQSVITSSPVGLSSSTLKLLPCSRSRVQRKTHSAPQRLPSSGNWGGRAPGSSVSWRAAPASIKGKLRLSIVRGASKWTGGMCDRLSWGAGAQSSTSLQLPKWE